MKLKLGNWKSLAKSFVKKIKLRKVWKLLAVITSLTVALFVVLSILPSIPMISLPIGTLQSLCLAFTVGALVTFILEQLRFSFLVEEEKILDRYGKYIINVKSMGSGLTTVSVTKFRDLLKLALRHKTNMQKKWVFHIQSMFIVIEEGIIYQYQCS